MLFVAALTVMSLPDLDPPKYPETRREALVETLHGVEIPDPYRWLEDPDSDETARWVAAQNELTRSWLAGVPERDAIRARLERLWNYERYGLPRREGKRLFYTRNEGLQNQAPLYVIDEEGADPRLLLDPNTLSEDGTVALVAWEVSPDGEWLAYATSSGGSDWMEWRIRSVDTGADLPDVVRWSKFSGAAWAPDSSGFYYARYDEPRPGDELKGTNLNQKLFFHRRGTDQSEDRLVYETPDQPTWGFSADVTDDGQFLVVSVWEGTRRENRVLVKDLRADGPFVPLLPDFDASYDFVDNVGRTLLFRTDREAPLGRVVAIDVDRPAPENWKTVVPEGRERIEAVSLVGGTLFVTVLRDAHSVVRRFTPEGAPLPDVELPGLGSVYGFGGKQKDADTFFSFTSFTTPATVYRYDVASGRAEVFRAPQVDFDPTLYETRQVFYRSKDGTRIPMFLVLRKGLEPTGDHPVLLTGYGGFGISITPYFAPDQVLWLEMGGVLAVANIRGGGEYGNAWHDAGRLRNKQNGFDDFFAACEWLVGERITRPERLAITGGSNGGLLMGAVITQRPHLVGAVVAAVGVFDMLRFHRFTIGWAWKSDYGDPEDPEDFRILLRYSPYHNVVPGLRYPATLITTGDHDDRVVPAHSFKFGAALQHAQAGEAPILLRIETRAGHGAGKPTSKVLDELADTYAFLVRVLRMTLPPGFGGGSPDSAR